MLLTTLAVPPQAAWAATPDAVELTTACEGTTSAGFTDTAGTTFEFEIDCFAHRGFTQGTGDGSTYEPFASNTRWQMATFIHRVLIAFAEQNEEFDVPEPSDQGFDDIGSLDAEFRDAINVLAELGVVEGRSSTRFEPYDTVRRDQMASFINRATGAIAEAFGDDPNGYTTDEEFFPDVDGNVHEDNINGIASEGIVQGRKDGRYHPADRVNRGQMAAFIMRWVQVLGFDGSDPSDPCEGLLLDAEVVDTNVSGILDTGDLLGLNFDVDLEALLDDGVEDVLRLEDDDGSIVEIRVGDRSLVDDGGLSDSGLIGDNGALIIGIGDDNVIDVASGDVAGLDLDNARVISLEDGFGGGGRCDDPIAIDDGDLRVLDLNLLDDGVLEDIVDLIDELLGDLLGDGDGDLLDVDDLLDGDLGGAFDDLLGGLL